MSIMHVSWKLKIKSICNFKKMWVHQLYYNVAQTAFFES